MYHTIHKKNKIYVSNKFSIFQKEHKKVQHRRRNRKTAQLEEPRQKKAKVEKKVKKAEEEQKCDQCDNVFSTRKLLAKHQFSGKEFDLLLT